MAESLMLGSMLLPACLGESDRSRQAGMAMDQSAADGLFLCRQIFHRLDDPWAGDVTCLLLGLLSRWHAEVFPFALLNGRSTFQRGLQQDSVAVLC